MLAGMGREQQRSEMEAARSLPDHLPAVGKVGRCCIIKAQHGQTRPLAAL